MKLTDNEKRDAVKLIEKGKPLPEKYRFLLFNGAKQVELLWDGKSDEITNTVLPFQIIEQVDEPRTEKKDLDLDLFESGRQKTGWTNKLIWGDNKLILSSLKNGPMRKAIEEQGGLKLIYIDPPFDVGADFSMKVAIGESSYEKKPNVLEQLAYRDTWGKGADSFLSMIYERLILMRDLLADDGSIYVHCDYRLNSQLRLILDEIFGNKNFVNEIVWGYKSGGAGGKGFAKKHDSLYFYAKNINNLIFEKQIVKRYVDKSKGYDPRIEYFKDSHGEYRKNIMRDLWDDIGIISPNSIHEKSNYPTQKPEALLERIIKASSNENDLVADFFAGSGTTAAVAEKLSRKWICTDLGKFAIHTTRKRMIGVQRQLKQENKNWRAFEILNLGKYQSQHYLDDGKTERDESEQKAKQEKEKEFISLILQAYQAYPVSGFTTINGKKLDVFVSIGPINQPLSRNHVEEVIADCLKNKITSVDILGFEYEMGLFPTIQEEARDKGLRLAYKQIPMEVFDKRAVEKGQVVFHDVAYIEFKSHIEGNKLAIELTDFAVFYNENNLNVEEILKNKQKKIVVESGQIVEKVKDANGVIFDNPLTKHWSDWVDYWSVDFDYESKAEIIQFKTKDGKVENEWTGNYVFENEWQSFRGKKGEEKLELITSKREIKTGKTKVAVKVVDIFGNDTMKVLEVKI